ncbi:MAG TPA: SLC13 family permease [Syntrophorhabdaceae bacterium]|nr:SLC13 family permease [Syntrophorhabdaceae bacterium]HQM80448.1 SLC13 family permease [Syntrophorhabdaceae bacterium]
MDFLQVAASVIFILSIILVITGWIDSVLAALLGILFMIFFGVMTDVQAFQIVDWNVIVILLSIWIISGFFGKSGVPDFLSAIILKMSKGNVAVFVTVLGMLAGFISMLIDNVVVVLMFAPVVFHACRRFKFAAFAPVLFVGLCSNFMGTAMLLGDLPPQMLHSVSGIEFAGFIWFQGRPSSFFILLISYIFTCAYFFWYFSRKYKGVTMDVASMAGEKALDHIKDKPFAIIACGIFVLTIIAMALRPIFGYHLGFIALWGALACILVFEIFKSRFTLEIPDVEQILAELDWRAIFFYVALFALVGGLEHSGVIKSVSNLITPLIQKSLVAGSTVLYWVTAPIVGIVEHDAYILTMLYVIRDLGKETGMNPWPLYWMLLWAGTLGSNLTIAGAPALFVAKNLGEKEDQRKVGLKEFFAITVPYVIISLIFCYIPAMLVWVVPFSK